MTVRFEPLTKPGQPVGAVFNQELVAILVHGWPVLVAGPLIVAALTYLGTFLLPLEYTSTTHLNIDRTTARSVESLMTSPSFTEAARAGVTPDQDRADWTVRVVDIDPLGSQQAQRLFRLDVIARDPVLAERISAELVELWRATTAPWGAQRVRLESDLARVETAVAANTALLETLQAEATFVLPQSDQGEIATSISNLLARRDEQLARASEIEGILAGIPANVVVAGPKSASRPSGPNRLAVALLATLASVPIVAAGLLVARTFGRRRKPAE